MSKITCPGCSGRWNGTGSSYKQIGKHWNSYPSHRPDTLALYGKRPGTAIRYVTYCPACGKGGLQTVKINDVDEWEEVREGEQ